jgi:hypothetical protein
MSALRKVVIPVSDDFKHIIQEVRNDEKQTTNLSSRVVQHNVRTENFKKFESDLKKKLITPLVISPPAHPVDPDYEYGSAAAIDEAQWDAAIAKAAANAGGRRRRKVKTVQRRRSHRRLRQTRRHRPF